MFKTPRMSVWFCAFCLIFGLPLVFIYPPFLASDEVPHFYFAYHVSEFRLVLEAHELETGSMLPSSLSETVGAVRENMLNVPDFNMKLMDDIPHIPLAPQEKEWTPFIALYSPLPYIPQSFGILIGRIFSLPPLTLHYIARICSLLAWAIIGMFALKIVPFYRNVLFVLLLTPLVFSKAVVITADVVTVGACALLVCHILKMAYGESGITRRDTIFLFGLAVFVGLCKISYAPLAALCFLIPPERLGGRKRFLLVCGGTVFAALVANMLWMVILAANLPLRTNANANPREQIMYMLRQPFSFARIVFNYTYDNLWINIQAIFGSVIVWREVWLPSWTIALLWASVLFAAVSDKPEVDVRVWKKAGVLAVVTAVYVVIIASLYVSFSRPMHGWVQGMQPRYMYPLLFPFLLVLKRKKVGKLEKFDLPQIHIAVTGVSLAVLIVSMSARFM